jgi:hypothetical protein
MDGEALVAATALALGAREGVLLVGLRMQEHREIAADRRYPAAAISSGVAPTTTQSRSATGTPNSSSRTAPPTTYAFTRRSEARSTARPPAHLRIAIPRPAGASQPGTAASSGVGTSANGSGSQSPQTLGTCIERTLSLVISGPGRKLHQARLQIRQVVAQTDHDAPPSAHPHAYSTSSRSV